MAEERIEIKYNKEDCPCTKCKRVMFCEERECAEFAEWDYLEKDIVYNRQEAIKKIETHLKASTIKFSTTPDVVAEIALNALLEVEK